MTDNHSPWMPAAAPADVPWTAPILWDHSTQVQTTMIARADVLGIPKVGRESYARKNLATKASRLLLVNRLRTNTIRVSSCYAPTPLLGSAWTPVRPKRPNSAFEMALCAWWNSTPGILTMLSLRAKSLDYPRFALEALRSLLVPNPGEVKFKALAEAFRSARSAELLPWPRMIDCPARALLDEAAARVLRIDGRRIAGWRDRIAREPTVSGHAARG